MMKTIRLALAFALATASTAALAQTAEPMAPTGSSYVQLRTGLYMPQSDDMEELEMNTGFGFDFVYGYRFHRNVAAEFGLGWYKAGSDEMNLFGTTMESDVTLMPITASARFIAPLGQVEPYALVGVGIFRTTLGATINDPEFGEMSGDESATALGLQLGGGAAFRISPNAYLGLDLRYVVAEQEFDGDGEDLPLDVSGLLLNAALGFTF